MLEAEDMAALDARIERVARVAVGAALEGVASVLEAGVSPAKGAVLLRELAIDIERGGRLDAPVVLSLRLDDGGDAAPEDELPEADDAAGVEAVSVVSVVEKGGRDVFADAEGEPPSPAMAEWLDLFDDRIRLSPHFVAAVNEAAAAGWAVSPNTARVVGERVRELRDAAASEGDGG